jgi:transposase
MSSDRRFHSPADKVAILRRHLLEHVPVSDLCEEAGTAPSLLYPWQREFFENGQAAFTKPGGRQAKKADEAKSGSEGVKMRTAAPNGDNQSSQFSTR